MHLPNSLSVTGDYLLSCSMDQVRRSYLLILIVNDDITIFNDICFLSYQHWAFSDIRTGRVLTKCVSDVSSTQCKL